MGGASTGSPCPLKQGLIQISFSVYPNQAQTSKKKKGNMSDAHSWNLTLYNIVGWGDRQNSSEQLPNGQRLTKQSVSKPNPWPLQQIPSCNLLCVWHEAGGAAGSPWHSDSWLLYLYQELIREVRFVKEETLPLSLFPEDSHGHFTLFFRFFSKGYEGEGARLLTTYRWPQWSIHFNAPKNLAQTKATQSPFYL